MLKIYAEPTAEPITLDDLVKNHINVDEDQTNDDPLIASMIVAARQQAEAHMARALVTQTWELTQGNFPCDGQIFLSYPPLVSVTHVKYYDTSNAQQTLSTDYYNVVTATGGKGYIELKSGYSWPSVYDRSDAIVVRYICGYGTPAAVPASIKHAMLIMVDNLNSQRGSIITGTIVEDTKAAEALMAPYRVVEF